MSDKQYSQHDEEQYILEWFDGRKDCRHRFLDIGAHNGITLSNTRRLFERGWSGVFVEPAAGPFRQLMANYKDAPGVSLVNAAVGIWSGLVRFLQSDDLVSSYDIDHLKRWEKTPLQETYLMMITISELLVGFPPPYDFVSLDTEGSNWEILQRMPLDRIGASLLCIEFDGRAREVLEHVRAFGYTEEVYRSNENLVVGRP